MITLPKFIFGLLLLGGLLHAEHTYNPATSSCGSCAHTFCKSGIEDSSGLEYHPTQPTVNISKDGDRVIKIDVEMCFASHTYWVPSIGELNYRDFGNCAYRSEGDGGTPAYPNDMVMPDHLGCAGSGTYAGLPDPVSGSKWEKYTVTNCASQNVIGKFNIFDLPTCNNAAGGGGGPAIEQFADAHCSSTIWRGIVTVGAYFPADKTDFQWLETTVVYRYPFKIILITSVNLKTATLSTLPVTASATATPTVTTPANVISGTASPTVTVSIAVPAPTPPSPTPSPPPPTSTPTPSPTLKLVPKNAVGLQNLCTKCTKKLRKSPTVMGIFNLPQRSLICLGYRLEQIFRSHRKTATVHLSHRSPST